jgi:hypothetical protein
MRVMHLNKYGSGMTSRTACGRNILRTPMSGSWSEFKADQYQCVKCETSKQADLFKRIDAKKEVAWKHDAPFNPQFLGAQPPQAGQDY